MAFHSLIVPLKSIVVKLLQQENAELPILVTLSGIVMLVIRLQLLTPTITEAIYLPSRMRERLPGTPMTN